MYSSYSLTFDGQHFTAINFNGIAPNAPGFVFENMKIIVDYTFKQAWSDMQTALIKPGLAPTKLETFFDEAYWT